MSDPTTEEYIEGSILIKNYGKDPFFRFSLQAELDDGTFLIVVHRKSTGEAINGAMRTTKAQIDRLKEMKLWVE